MTIDSALDGQRSKTSVKDICQGHNNTSAIRLKRPRRAKAAVDGQPTFIFFARDCAFSAPTVRAQLCTTAQPLINTFSVKNAESLWAEA